MCVQTNIAKKKSRKGLKIFFLILLLLIIIIAAVLGIAYWKTNKTFDKIYNPIEGKKKTSVTLNGSTPFSVLIMGVDERPGDRGRSDTLIATTINGKTNKTQMLSIPRDTKTEIIGHNSNEKINAAYAYGGVKMASDTTTEFLKGIPFNYYVKMNMEGFHDLVDAVGGVTVYNDTEGISLGKKVFHKGNVTLDGDNALAYVRIRKTDAQGDFGRQKRQQQVITAIVKKVLSANVVLSFNKIMNAVGDNVQTDFTLEDVTRIAKNYRGAVNNVENLQVQGTGGKINNSGPWYYSVSDNERTRLHDELAKNLEMNQ
ncbi:LCP family glycopolymer transferase [Listeria grayi]|uniref:Putative LytR protein n=1 Tax=Listeria grayi FSL F6-1183 TaxID=1265827 RepID=A0A829R513_LISGR|nr:LCP family protein [Listeria grayi]EUJ27590.1 putative LytR protein [Listeria grayi FSL F6-1183]